MKKAELGDVSEGVRAVLRRNNNTEDDCRTIFSDAYGLLVETVGKKDCKRELVEALLQDMEDQMPRFTNEERPYNALLRAYMASGEFKKATALASDMKINGIYLDKVARRISFSAQCAVGDLEKAEEEMREMKELGIEMNGMTYNWLCRGYARNRRIEELDGVMEVLRDMRVKLDAETRLEILDAYSSEGLFEQTLQLLKSLRATLDKRPGDMDEALSMALQGVRVPRELKYALQELERNGFRLTKPLLEEQVIKFCSIGRMEDASAFLNDMIKRRMDPSARCLSAMIKGFLSNEQESTALQLYQLTRDRRKTLGTSVKRALMKHHLDQDNFKEALVILSHFLLDGDELDEDTAEMLLECLLKRNQLGLAIEAAKCLVRTELVLDRFCRIIVIAIARELSTKLSHLDKASAKKVAISAAYKEIGKMRGILEDDRVLRGVHVYLDANAGDYNKAKATVEKAISEGGLVAETDQRGFLGEAGIQLYLKQTEEGSEDLIVENFAKALTLYSDLSKNDNLLASKHMNALFARYCCDHLGLPLDLQAAILRESGQEAGLFENLLDLGIWFYDQCLQAEQSQIYSEQYHQENFQIYMNPNHDVLEDAIVCIDRLTLNVDPAHQCQLLPIAVHSTLRSIAHEYQKNNDLLDTPIYGEGLTFTYAPGNKGLQLDMDLLLRATQPVIKYAKVEQGVFIPRSSMRAWGNEFSVDFRSWIHQGNVQ